MYRLNGMLLQNGVGCRDWSVVCPRSPSLKWCVPRSGPVPEVVCPPLRPVLRDDDHCVSFRVFASSRETNGVVCPRLRPISGRFVP
ncbi:MAG: hypothetical protein ACK5MO_02375, partial [Planctomyces sp.]